MRAVCALGLLALAGCHGAASDAGAGPFPHADRTISAPDADDAGSEAMRDRNGEAREIMDLAGIKPGMTVADIGAGEGYYTVRLAPRVGTRGRVLAEDIDRATLRGLGERVARERLDNVSITLGDTADPHLPAASFDRVFLVHVYHEVSEPYAFLWHLRPALRPGGSVVVVENDRAAGAHGIPPGQLECEFSAVGFRLASFVRKPKVVGYYAQFVALGPRPDPAAIRPCQWHGQAVARVR